MKLTLKEVFWGLILVFVAIGYAASLNWVRDLGDKAKSNMAVVADNAKKPDLPVPTALPATATVVQVDLVAVENPAPATSPDMAGAEEADRRAAMKDPKLMDINYSDGTHRFVFGRDQLRRFLNRPVAAVYASGPNSTRVYGFTLEELGVKPK